MSDSSFGMWLVNLLARLGARLPPLFPCAFVRNEADGAAVYEVAVSGKSLMVFWRLSGDENGMHEPTVKGGVVQGLAMLAVVNKAVSMWAPGRAVRKLDCDVLSGCIVRLEDTAVFTVRLKLVEGVHVDDKEERVEVSLCGLNRARGKPMKFMRQLVILHRRTNA